MVCLQLAMMGEVQSVCEEYGLVILTKVLTLSQEPAGPTCSLINDYGQILLNFCCSRFSPTRNNLYLLNVLFPFLVRISL